MANQTSNVEQQTRIIPSLCGVSAKPSWLSLSSQLKLPLWVITPRILGESVTSGPGGRPDENNGIPGIRAGRSEVGTIPDVPCTWLDARSVRPLKRGDDFDKLKSGLRRAGIPE